ncbi:MAG: hypothetical protein Q9169_000796 [Polycauliona sp. 2 TL-2023]
MHSHTPPPEYTPPYFKPKLECSFEESAVDQVPPVVTAKNVDHQGQTYSLLLPQAVRWLATVVFAALLVLVLWVYHSKGNFTRSDKNAFNVFVTGLSVGLGINFFEAFKESAKVLRWRLLADQRHTARELDLVLSIESLWKVFLLAKESIPARPWTVFLCTLWIALNVTAQISVALVTLTFDMVDGKNFNEIYTKTGLANASFLKCYDGGESYSCPSDATAHSRAHLYGDKIQGTPFGLYKTINDVVDSKDEYAYYTLENAADPEFAYRFNEYNPADLDRKYPLFTNRTITASSGECLVFEMNSTHHVNDVDGQGPGTTFTYKNHTAMEEITTPQASLGGRATTYIFKGPGAPQITDDRCGPRCIWLWAYKSKAQVDDQGPWTFYKCPITVSEVRNAWNHSQIVPDEVASIAAASIALQGRWSGSVENPNFRQYQFYPYGTPWEIHSDDPKEVGANMARFAIGSIAEMASANSQIQVPGLVPHLGSHLEIHWAYVISLFAGIIITHLCLILSAILATQKVVIKDDSCLAISRLLFPLFDVLGNEGTMLDGRKLAEVIQSRSGAGLIVGPMENHGSRGGYYLDIGKDVPLRKKWPNRRHPAGSYA